MTFWQEITTASNYATEPYPYAKNQLAHWALAYLLTAVVSAGIVHFHGEFADKWVLFAVMATGIAAWEALQYALNRAARTIFDHIEDWWFMTVYGVGSMVFLYDEVEPGSADAVTNAFYALPLLGVMAIHIAAGMAARMINRRWPELWKE